MGKEADMVNERSELDNQASEKVKAGGEGQEMGATDVGEASPTEAKGTAELEALRCEVAEWRAKADELLDKYKRSLADFVNYRKRQERDREEETLRIRMDVIRQFLPVVDDFERALKNVPDEHAKASWVEGITLIERKLKSILAGLQVSPIEALGQPFDPNLHSALLMDHSDEYPPGTVMEELQRGYRLADRVLRPTIVKVSNGPKDQKNAEDVAKQ